MNLLRGKPIMRGDQKQDSNVGITVYCMRGKMVLDNILGRNYYSDMGHIRIIITYSGSFCDWKPCKIFNSIMRSLSV